LPYLQWRTQKFSGGGSTNSVEDRGRKNGDLGAVAHYSGVPLNLQISETCILIRLLRMNFPWNWEFGSGLSKRSVGIVRSRTEAMEFIIVKTSEFRHATAYLYQSRGFEMHFPMCLSRLKCVMYSGTSSSLRFCSCLGINIRFFVRH
jgi:hypothetical protein